MYKKGQIISGDFVISIGVFIIIIIILVPLFNNLYEDMKEKQLNEDLQVRMFFIADALLKTEGLPSDWNQTNVKSLGFTDNEGKINKTKIRNFLSLDKTTAKNLLGLGGYEFNLSFNSGHSILMTGVATSPAAYYYLNESNLLGMINNSGLVWDLFYAGGSPPSCDARYTFTSSPAQLFDQMTGNSSNYKTIIIENAEISQPLINISALQYFLNSGGIIIYEGDPSILEGFEMHYNLTPNSSAISKDQELIDLPDGSLIEFNNSRFYFYHANGDADLHISAEVSGIAGGAAIGYWNVGMGRIYYVSDVIGNTGSQKISDVLGIIGNRAEYSTGQMSHAYAHTRSIVIGTDFNCLGTATLVVGK